MSLSISTMVIDDPDDASAKFTINVNGLSKADDMATASGIKKVKETVAELSVIRPLNQYLKVTVAELSVIRPLNQYLKVKVNALATSKTVFVVVHDLNTSIMNHHS
ncbi:hypothetical protein Tco_1073087 [Tanacetum coccineum]